MVDRSELTGAATGAATVLTEDARFMAPSRMAWLRAPRYWPAWLQVVAIYAIARLVTTVAMLIIATTLTATSRAGISPEFFDYSVIWDGDWYQIIAYYGYPTVLPRDASGSVMQNAWAFMPAYPFLVRAVSILSGLRWPVAAVATSLAFGFGAALVLYRILRKRLEHGTALFSILLFAVGPVSFIFQMGYAESMQVFLLTLALLLLTERRWAPLFPVIALMAVTRPTGLAFALALAGYWLVRYVRRESDLFPRRERIIVGAAVVFSGLSGLAWAIIAWVATGSMTAYTDTEISWRAMWFGLRELELFSPWFQAAGFWFGAPWGAVVVIATVLGFTATLFLPSVRRLGVELRLWMASYALYLFAVFFPQTSVFRLLVPMFPMAGALAQPRSTVYRVSIVVVLLTMQLVWLWVTWGPIQAYWTTP